MKKLAEKIKNGKAWAWVKDNAPEVLEIVGEVPGLGVLEKIGGLLSNKQDITPDQLAEFNRLKELDLQELELILQDKDSARKREVGVVQALGKLDPMQIVTGSVGLGSLVILIIWAFVGVDKESEKIYFHLLGVVEGIAIAIFSYYFGSSKGSKDKQQIIDSIK